ncbi:MAG TPA: hypothetical protein PK014_13700 [Thermoanaerobaculia bacterium]|nr:hypothetical protein [Thermoanaerobaculia bacterium]HUM31094.1 hypothetical protein [Thermoanaerobaculia bacterium]HXK69450.1 hypothetical protein [Thermoanaerobaculia bacterium]
MIEQFQVETTPEFDKDFKALEKRYRTLKEDFQIFLNAQLAPLHKLGIDNGGAVPISDLGNSPLPIYKAKKFACRSLKGKGARTGIRVIYAYNQEINQLTFIEIYIKSDKENEDRKRIDRYLSSIT